VEASARHEWNAYVLNHQRATLCHLFEWKEILEECYKRRCFLLCLRDTQGITGILPLVHLKSRLAGNRLVSMPFLDQGGVLASSTRTSEALVQAALDLCRGLRAQGLDLRSRTGPSRARLGESNRYRFILRLGEPEEIWRTIGPKVRNQVRKSEKSALVTTRVAAQHLEQFFAVFSRNMHQLGSPVHSREFFRSILSRLGDRAALYLTFDDNRRAVAGGIAIRFRDVVTVPWASSLPAVRSSCPNHSLYWQVLQDAGAEGARFFDFGRSTEDTGTYRFKKQWNATPIPLIWSSFDRDGAPTPERHLNSQNNRTLARLWSRLPETVATRLGPLIRRELSN